MDQLPEPTELKLPIAICDEHIATRPTILRIKRHVTPAFLANEGDFTISTCADEASQEGTNLFSVNSDLALERGLSQRRRFRDDAGLPLFDLQMKGSGATWLVQLPGDSTCEPMAVLAPRWDMFTNKMHVYVMNSADDRAEVKLEVRGQVMFWKFTTEVYLDGALVVSAKVKDIRHFEWVVKVAKGFDVSLVGLLSWYW